MLKVGEWTVIVLGLLVGACETEVGNGEETGPDEAEAAVIFDEALGALIAEGLVEEPVWVMPRLLWPSWIDGMVGPQLPQVSGFTDDPQQVALHRAVEGRGGARLCQGESDDPCSSAGPGSEVGFTPMVFDSSDRALLGVLLRIGDPSFEVSLALVLAKDRRGWRVTGADRLGRRRVGSLQNREQKKLRGASVDGGDRPPSTTPSLLCAYEVLERSWL